MKRYEIRQKHFAALGAALRGIALSEDALCAIIGFCRAQNPRFNEDTFVGYMRGDCGPSGGAVVKRNTDSKKEAGARDFDPTLPSNGGRPSTEVERLSKNVCELREALISILAHHRVLKQSDLSDTLTDRIIAAREAIARSEAK